MTNKYGEGITFRFGVQSCVGTLFRTCFNYSWEIRFCGWVLSKWPSHGHIQCWRLEFHDLHKRRRLGCVKPISGSRGGGVEFMQRGFYSISVRATISSCPSRTAFLISNTYSLNRKLFLVELQVWVEGNRVASVLSFGGRRRMKPVSQYCPL